MICSRVPYRFRNQPNCGVAEQLGDPAQQMVPLPLMSRVTPSEFNTKLCCCRLDWVSVYCGPVRPVAEAASDAYCVVEAAFHVAKFQSQTPYKLCVAGWKPTGAALVNCTRWPVPKETMMVLPPAAVAPDATTGAVVIG